MGLVSRLMLLVVLAVLPGLGVQVLSLMEHSRQALVRIENEALLQARQLAADKEEILAGADYLFVALSKTLPVMGFDRAVCSAVAGRLTAAYPRFDAIGAVDADGAILCANDGAGNLESLVSLVAPAGVRDAVVVGHYAVGSAGGVLPLLFPTEVAGRPVTFFALLDLDWLARKVDTRPLPEGATVLMTDRAGTIIARWPEHGRWVGHRSPAVVASQLEHPTRTLRTRGVDGTDRIYGIVPLAESPSGVTAVVGLPVRGAIAELWAATIRNVVLVALGLALGVGLAYAGARRLLLGPIRALCQAAQRWGAGDLAARVAMPSAPAELRDLAARLEDMAGRLAERERQLVEAHAAAAEASRTKSRLLAAAGHDLRQPVHAIGLAATMLDGQTTDAGRRMVDLTRKAAAKLGRALDTLVEASRLESGLVQPRREAFAIGEALVHARDEWALAAAEKGLRLRVVGSTQMVDSDRHMLATVLDNLVANAVRYTERGGVLIGCRRGRGVLWVVVCDTGIGIPPDALERIWGEFHQVDHSRREGFGLGLSIVQRTAELLGHGLDVRSRPGRGSCFSIALPLAETQRGDEDGHSQQASGQKLAR